MGGATADATGVSGRASTGTMGVQSLPAGGVTVATVVAAGVVDAGVATIGAVLAGAGGETGASAVLRPTTRATSTSASTPAPVPSILGRKAGIFGGVCVTTDDVSVRVGSSIGLRSWSG